MIKDTWKAEVKEVVGPLPDGNKGLIILEAGNKTFPVICPLPDAASCYCHLYGSPFDSPYLFLSSSLASLTNVRLDWAEITEVEGTLYAQMLYRSPEWEKPVRRSTANPAEAVNMCLASGRDGIGIDKEVLDRIVDSSDAFVCLRKQLGALWPLPLLTDTLDLQALYDYIEDAMPGGSVFKRST